MAPEGDSEVFLICIDHFILLTILTVNQAACQCVLERNFTLGSFWSQSSHAVLHAEFSRDKQLDHAGNRPGESVLLILDEQRQLR